MTAPGKQFVLGFSLAANGTHKGGWRHPRAQPDVALDFAAWKEMAQAAERAKFHFIFLADGAAVRTEAKDQNALSYNGRIEQFEPLTLIAGLAAATEKIGFIATASTTYNEPYTVARKYASLDHLSGGRVGWNVVTSWSEAEAKNFNRDAHMEHGARYRRAEEFVDVVTGLWDSWEDDAFIRDQAEGRYFDADKLHVLNHKGEFFSVKGPLNVSRPLQGYPVIAQAGSSEPGQALAARTADLVYTAKQNLADAQRFYAGMKDRVKKAGRSPDSVKIMPGVLPIVGATEAEAQAKYEELQALVHPQIGLSMLMKMFGDLSGYPLDGPLPEDLPEHNGVQSIRQAWRDRAKREGMSIRQLYQTMAIASGHLLIVGTPETVADKMEEWFTNGACDGFNIMVPYMPAGVHDFIDAVLPELRRRGRFRDDYEGDTLREDLGLARPENMFAHPAPGRIGRSAAAQTV